MIGSLSMVLNVFVAPVLLVMRLAWPRGRALADALLSGALIQGVYLGGIFWAIDRGMPTGIAALIVSLQPIMTSLLAWPILGERPSMAQWAGLSLGLAGAVMVLQPRLAVAESGVDAVSLGVSLVALFSITLGTIHQKRQKAGPDPRTSFAVQFIGAVAVVGIAAAVLESRPVIWSGEFIFALTWLTVVLSLGAFSLLILMLRHNAVSKVAALFYLIPVITAAMAYPLFGEMLSPLQLGGMALVVAAVILASRGLSEASRRGRAQRGTHPKARSNKLSRPRDHMLDRSTSSPA